MNTTYAALLARPRYFEAHGPQPLEQIAVDVLPRFRLDAARASGRPVLCGPPLAGQDETRLSVRVLEERDAVVGQLEHGELGVKVWRSRPLPASCSI